MVTSHTEIVREAWAALGRGDVAAVASAFSDDVRWYGEGDPAGGCRSRSHAVEFIERALAAGIRAQATQVDAVDDRVVVTVQVQHPPESGDAPEPHGEVVTLRDGLIAEIVVYETVLGAMRAVGRAGGSPAAGAVGPVVELLYFDGCPGYERLLATVERLLEERGHGELRVRAVTTPEQADAERFLGSPTLRVDGADVDPGAADRTDFGLKCRLFRFEGGQSGLPPETWIRAALERARVTPAP